MRPPARMRGLSLLLARAVWLAVALLAVGVFVASVPAYFAELQTVCTSPHARCVIYAGYSTALQVAFGIVYCGVGALIFRRGSENRGALLTSFWLVVFGTTFPGITSVLERSYPALDIFYSVLSVLGNLGFLLLFYLFPDGRFVPRWTRWVAIFFAAYFIVDELYPNSPYNPDNWGPLLGVPFFLILAGSMMYAQVYRYRRVSGPRERQQTKWPVLGFIAASLAFFGLGLRDIFQLFPRDGGAGMLSELVYETVGYLAFLLIPLSIRVAINRHHLYDITDIIMIRVHRAALIISTVITILMTTRVVGVLLVIGGVTFFLLKWPLPTLQEGLLPTLQALSKRLPPSLQAAIVGGVLTFASNLALQLQRSRGERQEQQTAMKEEDLRSQNEALRSYLGSIHKLLLDHRLREQPRDSDVRRLAQIQTTMLSLSLRGDGKGRLLQLIYDLNLISRTNPVIELRNATLTTTNLREGNLKGADLSGADLSGADLSGADLRNTNLSDADLSNTCLSDTCLAGANLFGAYLSGADLRGADLKDAKGVSNKRLQEQAKYLKGATMPNGQRYEY